MYGTNIRILYLYVTLFGDIRYNNRSYASVGIDEVGIDEVGIDKVGIDEVGRYRLPLAEQQVKPSNGVYLRLYQYL